MKVPGSGRQRGTPNKKTKSLEEKVEALGIDPFELLLSFAQGDNQRLNIEEIPLELRFKAIKEVCSYLYPKRKSVEVITTDENKVQSYEDYLALLE